jgi:hypothetical protein
LVKFIKEVTMNKLITKTTQCGYRVLSSIGNNCTCPGGEKVSCHYEEFPVSCPLSDGISTKDHLENMFALKNGKCNIGQVKRQKRGKVKSCHLNGICELTSNPGSRFCAACGLFHY